MPSITQTLALVAATLSLAQAITIKSPSKFELWDSSKSNTITWSSVSTDPQTFDVYLSHMAAHPPLYSLLFSSVSASAGKIDVSGLQLPNGDAYQINFVAHDNDKQILSQSQQFNVTGEAVAATKTLDGYTGPTYTPSASGTKLATGTKSATTLTKTTTDASGSATTETSTSTPTESSESSTASGTDSDEAPSQTAGPATGTASTTPTRTPNAAVENVAASGSLVALFMGLAAFLA